LAIRRLKIELLIGDSGLEMRDAAEGGVRVDLPLAQASTFNSHYSMLNDQFNLHHPIIQSSMT
jgi:hypothetical protein